MPRCDPPGSRGHTHTPRTFLCRSPWGVCARHPDQADASFAQVPRARLRSIEIALAMQKSRVRQLRGYTGDIYESVWQPSPCVSANSMCLCLRMRPAIDQSFFYYVCVCIVYILSKSISICLHRLSKLERHERRRARANE